LIYQPNHPSAALGGVARTSGLDTNRLQFPEAYAVYLWTRNQPNAGTDAVLTITLTGDNGSASTTVDTAADTNYGYSIAGSRMEVGQWIG
jgi:hypothetical protein